MSLCVIEPRDPILVRDARPFQAGSRARSLPFPFPSTIAGAVRTRLGQETTGLFDGSSIHELLKHQVRGPFLCELDEQERIREFFFPAPADAVLFEGPSGKALRRQVRPVRIPQGGVVDQTECGLVGITPVEVGKPIKLPPRYWSWEEMRSWLLAASDRCEVEPERLGCQGPARETRTHVSIREDTGTAEEGRLFQTEGLRFSLAGVGQADQALLSLSRRLALAVATKSVDRLHGVASLGGERRVSVWRSVREELPRLPEELVKAVIGSRAFRLVLTTPAFFVEGWKPRALLNGEFGMELELLGAAVGRPEVVAGWDLAGQRARPSRRLAGSGSVYFLRCTGAPGPDAIRNFLQALWLQSVSDREQDRLDGFGVALIGNWDGQQIDLFGG